MDKKNTILGVLFLLAAGAAMFYSSSHAPKPAPLSPAQVSETASTSPASTQAPAPVVNVSNAAFAAVAHDDKPASDVSLSNDFVEVRFTEFGGAILNVAFKKYPAIQGKPEAFIFNDSHVDPILAFTADTFPGLARHTHFDIISQTPTEVVFRTVFENRIEVLRRYSILPAGATSDKSDPYVIRHELTFRNLTDQTLVVPAFSLALGTAAPNNAADNGQYLNTGYNIANEIDFVTRGSLESTGFLGFGSKGPLPYVQKDGSLIWASVQNQYFAGILTPDQPGRQLLTRRVELPAFAGSDKAAIGITGAVAFDAPALQPKGEKTLGFNFYAGPKEYKRLSNGDIFKHDEDHIMNFGFTRYFSQALLTIMTTVHEYVGNWGIAIILTTISLKLIFLPLTLSASKSAKRMQKVQPQLAAVREKYKDNPQKLNQATMDLFKEHKVNPLGGCIPVLITIPFFWGFFRMLPSAAELRFAHFLWSNDLSAPDTIAHIAGLPINIMPILMGATMIFQMRLTPQPTVDNAQAKMFKFMPYMFAFFCYGFSAALSLYSTINGLFTIGQQLIINRMKDDAPVAATPVGKTGKPVKNVTPKKS